MDAPQRQLTLEHALREASANGRNAAAALHSKTSETLPEYSGRASADFVGVAQEIGNEATT
jgi:hypothetical protein